MDKTKEFILQCEKAKEIQKARPVFYVGNTYTFFETGMGFMIHGRHTGIFFKTMKCGYALTDMPNSNAIYLKEDVDLKKVLTWLPRQDQLQEMISKNNGNCDWYDVLEPLINYYQSEEFELATSMEQLWLAFVMKEKYGKTWDGEEWEKVK